MKPSRLFALVLALVLHSGDAREAIDAAAAEDLASGHWRVLHLPIDTTGVTVERG